MSMRVLEIEMANDFHIQEDGEQELAELNMQEYELFIYELQTLGVKNVNRHNGTRNIRNREINQSKKYEPSRNIAHSSGKEAPPF